MKLTKQQFREANKVLTQVLALLKNKKKKVAKEEDEALGNWNDRYRPPGPL